MMPSDSRKPQPDTEGIETSVADAISKQVRRKPQPDTEGIETASAPSWPVISNVANPSPTPRA